MIQLYTDGAVRTNPGPGAWAYIIISENKQEFDSTGFKEYTTNNRMEIQAAIEGIRKITDECLAGKITVYSDSQYLVNCMAKKWYAKWIKMGWKRKKQREVKNEDLWRELVDLVQRLDIDWQWIRGHNGNLNNEKCDFMACLTIENNLDKVSQNYS